MKAFTAFQLVLAVALYSVARAAPDVAMLSQKLTVTPEIKRAFQGSDAIEVAEITGTVTNFQVGGIYRVIGGMPTADPQARYSLRRQYRRAGH